MLIYSKKFLHVPFHQDGEKAREVKRINSIHNGSENNKSSNSYRSSTPVIRPIMSDGTPSDVDPSFAIVGATREA